MSIISDIKSLHTPLAILALSVGMCMPFWYVSIYLFGSMIMDSRIPFYIPIVFSFCLSLCWSGFNSLLSITLVRLKSDATTEEKKKTAESQWVLSVFLSVFIIATMIAIFFLIKEYKKSNIMNIRTFTLIAFLLDFILIVLFQKKNK